MTGGSYSTSRWAALLVFPFGVAIAFNISTNTPKLSTIMFACSSLIF
jgi:hypothetical protein